MHTFLYQDVLIFQLHILLTKKVDSFHKDFELYLLFMHNIVSWYMLLPRRTKIFRVRVSTYFGQEKSRVWHRKSQTKTWQNSQKMIELYQIFMNNFLCQTGVKPKCTYYFTTLILCHYPPKVNYFWLSLYYLDKPNVIVEFKLSNQK